VGSMPVSQCLAGTLDVACEADMPEYVLGWQESEGAACARAIP
jgi:hypothetical protein